MKYKAQAENFAERFALWAGMVPIPMVDSLFPLVKTRALMSGVRHGVFDALKEGPLTPASLSEKLKLDPESLELLLRVLAASEYLTLKDTCFALTPLARKTLLKGSPMEC